MDLLHNLFVLLHLVGFAALFGGAFVQMKGPKRIVNPAMFHGALTQLVTGIVLVVIDEFGPDPVNHMKIGIKLLVLIVIMVLVILNRKKSRVPDAAFWSIFGLTLANAAIAVFW
ncbi:MAG: hypothetical protein ABIS84_02580 [Arachnia sp.]